MVELKSMFYFSIFAYVCMIVTLCAPIWRANWPLKKDFFKSAEHFYTRYIKQLRMVIIQDSDFVEEVTSPEKLQNPTELSELMQKIDLQFREKLNEIKCIQISKLTRINDVLYEVKKDKTKFDFISKTGLKFEELEKLTKILNNGKMDLENPLEFSQEDLFTLLSMNAQDTEDSSSLFEEIIELYDDFKLKIFGKTKPEIPNCVQLNKNIKDYLGKDNKTKVVNLEETPMCSFYNDNINQDKFEDEAELAPKSLFFIYDLDCNGMLNITELEMMLLREIKNLCDESQAKCQPLKLVEKKQMIMKKLDANKDGEISLSEFSAYAKLLVSKR